MDRNSSSHDVSVKSLIVWVTAVAGFEMNLVGPSLRWTSWEVKPSLQMEDPLLPLGD